MNLPQEIRTEVIIRFSHGDSISLIACKMGLLREYVQEIIKNHNQQPIVNQEVTETENSADLTTIPTADSI